MKDLTPNQEIIKMHKDGCSLYQISTKVGLETGYVVRQINEYYQLNGKLGVAYKKSGLVK